MWLRRNNSTNLVFVSVVNIFQTGTCLMLFSAELLLTRWNKFFRSSKVLGIWSDCGDLLSFTVQRWDRKKIWQFFEMLRGTLHVLYNLFCLSNQGLNQVKVFDGHVCLLQIRKVDNVGAQSWVFSGGTHILYCNCCDARLRNCETFLWACWSKRCCCILPMSLYLVLLGIMRNYFYILSTNISKPTIYSGFMVRVWC